MNKLSSFATLLIATLFGVAAESAWSNEARPNMNAAPAVQTAAPMTGFVPGPYQPPPNRGRYAHPWQQPSQWPAPPRGYAQLPSRPWQRPLQRPVPRHGYGQLPPRYQPRGQYRAVPAAPAAVENPLSAELKQIQQQLTAKSTQLDNTQATLEQYRVKLRGSLETEQALKEKLANITSEQQAVQARATELTAVLIASTATLEKHRQQIANEQQQNQLLTAERDQLRGDLAGRDKQLATLQAELQELTQALQQARSEAATSGQQLSKARKLNNSLSELTTKLRRQKTALLKAEQTRTTEHDSLRSDLASRDKQQATLQTELQVALKALEQARSEASMSSRLLSETRVQNEAFKHELSELASQLGKRKTTLIDTEQLLAAVTAERKELQADLAACSQQLTGARDALTTARSELDALRQAPLVDAGTAVPAPDRPDKVKQAASNGLLVDTVEIPAPKNTETDADKDGVADDNDLCTGTRQGVAVDSTGCAAGVAINLENVNFLYNSHKLTTNAQRILDRVAGILSRLTDTRLEVAGHTDTQGDPSYNQWLSRQRAENVRDYLVAQGVNPDRISAAGYGGQRPIANNSTREGLRRNRRVELRRLQ